MKTKKVIPWIIVIVTGVILAYVWYGFLFPDPYYLSRFWPVFKFLYIWTTRLLIPLLFFAMVLLLVLKKKKILQNIGLLMLTLFVLTVILYPIMDVVYFVKTQSKNKVIKEQYHSFLQLMPPNDQRLDHPVGKHTIRIFCLGGSTTEFKDSKGVGWTERLEKELRQIYNSDSILVFNFGKQWYTTLHSRINYEINLRQYKPDVIIVMHNINDLLQNADFSYLSNGPFRKDYGHFYGPSSKIIKRSGLFGYFWTKLTPMWNHKERITFDQDTFPGLVPFTGNINSIIDQAIMDSTEVILLTQPNIYSENMDEKVKHICAMINFEAVGENKQWGFKTAFVGMKQYNERIKTIADKRNVFFIDLEKYIPKTLTYFYDEVHYNDTSYNLISKSLSTEIVRLKVLPFKN
jgi:hypothetical protein